MEIEQGLTLNRQAFDAELSIGNAWPATSLTNLDVVITFYDEELNEVTSSSSPASTNALFFVQPPVISGIDQLPGGTLAPNGSAVLRWLIIPTLDASTNTTLLSSPVGELFYVGAVLQYGMSGTDYTVEVAPDAIRVQPMPELQLDYFLPGKVYADNPLTTDQVEDAVPFSLGLRVKNIGCGWAHDVVIESGQPSITANDQQLAVAYTIEGSEVNGSAYADTLRVAFGNLQPQTGAALARWTMTSSLSGSFTNFDAFLSHADELGGTLTSFIPPGNIATHLLRRDVLVDHAGSDAVRDFLTADDHVYESNGGDFSVSNVSEQAGVTAVGPDRYVLSLSRPASGAIYACATNPASGDMVLSYVMRSDGKVLDVNNVWLESPYDQPGVSFFNLFDSTAANHSYIVAYEPSCTNTPPVITSIPDQTVLLGNPIVLLVQASDPDGTIPRLSAMPMPAGARFADNGDGTGLFSWTPAEGQESAYRIRFAAADNETESSQRITIDAVSQHGNGPDWWTERGVLIPDTAANDYAAANQGQVKWMAACAAAELDSCLAEGAGDDIWQMVARFGGGGDYMPVNLGQLKAVAAPFYVRLGLPLPWAHATNANDYAVANIGQVKNVFSFEPQEE